MPYGPIYPPEAYSNETQPDWSRAARPSPAIQLWDLHAHTDKTLAYDCPHIEFVEQYTDIHKFHPHAISQEDLQRPRKPVAHIEGDEPTAYQNFGPDYTREFTDDEFDVPDPIHDPKGKGRDPDA